MGILGEEAVTLTRYAAGSVGSDGRRTIGAGTASTIMASVQPLTGRQLQRLPEGERQSYPLVIYTVSDVRTADHIAGVPADRITTGGNTYEVGRVQRWPAAGPLPHYEAYLMRLDETGGAP